LLTGETIFRIIFTKSYKQFGKATLKLDRKIVEFLELINSRKDGRPCSFLSFWTWSNNLLAGRDFDWWEEK